MSELRPSSPIRRPDTARPRTADEHEHEHEVGVVAGQGDQEPLAPPASVDPVSLDELVRIQRHMVGLPRHAGATITQDDDLGVVMVRVTGGGPTLDYAAMPRWEAATWRASLARVEEAMRRDGAWPSFLLADRLDRPPGMDGPLATMGWRRLTGEQVLWVGHASVVPHLDRRLRFEAVQPGTVAEHEALEREVFGVDPGRAAARREELASALRAGGLRAYLVRLGDQPIAVARLSQGEGVAGIYALGVAPAWRGQGYGTLIATIVTRAGLATGNRVVWLSVEEGNDRARRVYQRLGFQHAFGWARWLGPPRG